MSVPYVPRLLLCQKTSKREFSENMMSKLADSVHIDCLTAVKRIARAVIVAR